MRLNLLQPAGLFVRLKGVSFRIGALMKDACKGAMKPGTLMPSQLYV